MSQDASSQQMLLKPTHAKPWVSDRSGEPVEGGFSVESYADRLMDDLFDEVESALEMRTPAAALQTAPQALINEPVPGPIESPRQESVLSGDLSGSPSHSSDTSSDYSSGNLAQMGLPLALRSQPSTPDETALLAEMVAAARRTEQNQPKSGSYDRLLLAVGCVSIIVSLALWLFSREATQVPTPIAVAPASPSVASNSNSQFADYVKQAVQAIDQRTQSTQSGGVATAPGGIARSPLPTVSVPGTPTVPAAPTVATRPRPATPAARSTGLERVFVPVYQMPPNLFNQGAPAVVPLPKVQPGTPAKPAIPLAIPGVARTLVGVAEMGENSAALIEINGVVQRFRLGESIGSTGWALVEVSKNQAVLRRNGEVRSILVGQSF